MSQIQVGFSDVFFSALTLLPANIQAKVNQTVLKFQSNPTSPGLNYEKLVALKDNTMRSLRVDQTYRIILSAPKAGNIYLFLWVDHHDDAYSWATRHQCHINPNTGTLQLYKTQIQQQNTCEDVNVVARSFYGLKDRQLLKLGVPEDQIPHVRKISSEHSLDKLQPYLPSEAYEGLFLYLAGDSYEDILRDREVDENKTYDVENYSEALQRTQTKTRFIIPDSDELIKILNAPMEKWRVFLHSSQRRIANGDKNGPMRVLGGAGTGKTVVAMHRARWLADQIKGTDKKVLFTTFTRNLAIDIRENLKNICSKDEFNHIEIINLDRWVQNFLRKYSYNYQVIFDNKTLKRHWAKALLVKPADIDLPDSFFIEEWQNVIQTQGITDINEYKRASRLGRGTSLDRSKRVRIWPVFEQYRHILNINRQKEIDDAYRDASQLITSQDIKLPYTSLVIDEAQDMGAQPFALLRAIVPEGKNDLFIVGDAHQRIYGRNRVVLSRCGINIRGRSKKLKINYRTTDEIRTWATDLLDGREIDDLDGGFDNNNLYKSLTHGTPPIIKHFDDAEQQANYIQSLLIDTDLPGSHTCIVARTNREVFSIQSNLDNLGIKTVKIQPNETANSDENAARIATVHRVKGLEFDRIILASVNDGLIPLDLAMQNKADQTSLENSETEERSLVFVAITRARKAAYVLSYGIASPFLKDELSDQV